MLQDEGNNPNAKIIPSNQLPGGRTRGRVAPEAAAPGGAGGTVVTVAGNSSAAEVPIKVVELSDKYP